MKLKSLQLQGFKSFAHSNELIFDTPITAIVGPNGSGKSNIVEALRFVLGEQSMKSLRGGSGPDLIFKGSGGGRSLNRASVSLIFDNSDRIFHLTTSDNNKISLDFDEITITREVFSDGQNTYSINGHIVRLRDIMEVISSVNIGASGYHIISQGEADRLLNANLRERRFMLEDALGLKIYHYRIKEAQRKLDKTREHMKEAKSLRREIAPHMNFLKHQVDKIEKAITLRKDLLERMLTYCSTEEAYLRFQREELENSYEKVNYDIITIGRTLDEQKSKMDNVFSKEENRLKDIAKEYESLRHDKDEITRLIGRVEGTLEAIQTQVLPSTSQKTLIRISWGTVVTWMTDIDREIVTLQSLKSVDEIISGLKKLQKKLRTLQTTHRDEQTYTDKESAISDDANKRLIELKSEYATLSEKLSVLVSRENDLRTEELELLAHNEEHVRLNRDREQSLFALHTQHNELQSKLNMLTLRLEAQETAERAFQEELDEAETLIGPDIKTYSKEKPSFDFTTPSALDMGAVTSHLENERRSIERIKIKIEEIGGGSGTDIIQEYNEVTERDKFLEREINDLEASMKSLEDMMNDLTMKLRSEFEKGIENINIRFNDLFKTMFGGGNARVNIAPIEQRRRKSILEDEITEEDIDGNNSNEDNLDEDSEDLVKEEGIDVIVQLPRKRVQDLQMLSGGERSLTSIAFLFALTQVNPPPFLVLDETDATLDEANSQRYGDMIQNLSSVSQLIIVTHNRETMSRAHVLYGVTLGSDNSSQLLSVKLEDAVQYAK